MCAPCNHLVSSYARLAIAVMAESSSAIDSTLEDTANTSNSADKTLMVMGLLGE